MFKRVFLSAIVVGVGLAPLSYSASTDTLGVPMPLRTVLVDPVERARFAPFMSNVLRMVPENAFFNLVDVLEYQYHPKTDFELYQLLIKHIDSIKPRFFPVQQLKALAFQKDVLGAQAKKLLGDGKHFAGCVEIGHPGVYTQAVQRFATVQGPIYYLNDKERLIDRAQASSYAVSKKFKAYDTFVPLNDYAPIAESAIASNSVDLVICFVGLHHIPVERLDAFVASIARILRPGGVFLLRDHDAHNDSMKAIVSAAHSVFNAVVVGTREEELGEYRNFRELLFWIESVEKCGLVHDGDHLLQDGDPTLNTMVLFTKQPTTEQERIDLVSHALKNRKDYVRDITQTMLTVPEWHDVDRSQAYGEFINHTPFYEYPYFENIRSYWDVYRKSWNLARTQRSLSYLLTSEYTFMNTFIGVMTTFEYAAKGIISWPFKKMMSGVETGTIQMLVKDPRNEINSLDQRIKVLDQYNGAMELKLIDVPRYKEFLNIMIKLADTDIQILEIAGQKHIQFKVRYKDAHLLELCQQQTGCTKAYDWQVPTIDATYSALLVPVDGIKHTIKVLKQLGIELLYIHDF